jgi:cytochrome c peroxidase
MTLPHELVFVVSAALLGASLAACNREPTRQPVEKQPSAASKPQTLAEVSIGPAALGMFAALPAAVASPETPITEEKVRLGRMLYHDVRLSIDQDISCNSCHDLAKFGVDGKPVSEGHKQAKGSRNSPTVYNAAGHFAQFWDARAATVEEQAKGPVLEPDEMGMPNADYVIKLLKSIPGYLQAFQQAFPDQKDPVTYDNVGEAIGAFERKLVTPARWDRLLEGKPDALTREEKRGFLAFVDAGCATCHSGPYVGGTMLQRLGAVKPWPNQKDLGRYQVTRQEAEKMAFKVPGLRNVEHTAPYFHDASSSQLPDAVKKMAEHQLGKGLTDEQTGLIVTWLGSLTGKVPEELAKAPELPESGPTTPKPPGQ